MLSVRSCGSSSRYFLASSVSSGNLKAFTRRCIARKSIGFIPRTSCHHSSIQQLLVHIIVLGCQCTLPPFTGASIGYLSVSRLKIFQCIMPGPHSSNSTASSPSYPSIHGFLIQNAVYSFSPNRSWAILVFPVPVSPHSNTTFFSRASGLVNCLLSASHPLCSLR